MWNTFVYAKRRIDSLIDTDPDVLKSLQAENPDKWSVSSFEAVKDAIRTFVRAGTDGPVPDHTYTATKQGPTVSREQSQRSLVPKPDGTFGKFSVLV